MSLYVCVDTRACMQGKAGSHQACACVPAGQILPPPGSRLGDSGERHCAASEVSRSCSAFLTGLCVPETVVNAIVLLHKCMGLLCVCMCVHA